MPELRDALLVRFGVFELNLQSGDLRKAGMRVRLSGQPLSILIRLVSRPGELVTREDLRRALWSDDTFVDFERNLNSAIKRLRAALGDSAEAPQYIETLPKRGYRFLAPVRSPEAPPTPQEQPRPAVSQLDAQAVAAEREPRVGRRPWILTAGTVLIAVGAIGMAAYRWSARETTSIRSLVVLPFVNVTPADGQIDDYLAFGMTDAMVTEISKLGSVAVISQTSASRYAAPRKPVREIAKELGVDAVVEGSVMRDGNHVRIAVQLVDARRDVHLWAATYEREIERMFPVFRDVAGDAARALTATIAPARARNPRRDKDRVDQRVYELHVRGRYHLAKGAEPDFRKARQYFEQAISIDETHAPSHSGLADYYVLTDALAPRVAFPQARRHAGRALSLDSSLADAHVSLAFVHYYGDWAWHEAERAFTRALTLDPNHARGHRWFGLFLAAVGRHDEARAQIGRALAVDPIAPVNHDAAATTSFNARAYERVLAHAQKILDLEPGDPRGFEHLSLGLLYTGKHERALAVVDRGLSLSNGNSTLRIVRAICLARLGRTEEADAMLSELDSQEPDAEYVPPIFIAAIAAALGQHDRALERLEHGYQTRDPYLVLLKESPLFDPLRDLPRFRRISSLMKFPS
jgi:TolB-like protein/DNA-binding winged helix-turn-helix (wHTH) protein/tetratricopeptide (TPR) repeat protein